MTLTARQLALATLDRQMLLRRERLDVTEAVRRLCALQAQEPASPYLALWNRLEDFAFEDLDAAFTQGSVVKASLMRITLHAVHTDDHAPFRAAMLQTLRGARLADARFRATGLALADADALVPGMAGYLARARTGVEVERELAETVGEHAHRVWWALRTYAPVRHAPTGGPWSFGHRNAYLAAAPAVAAAPSPEEAADGAGRLLLAYLRAFGPASAADFARFTLLTRPVITRAVNELGDRLVGPAGPGPAALLDLPEASVPAVDTPAPPRLLPMWDSSLLAHAAPGRLIPPGYRPLVVRRNGDILPCVLVDGQVAGVWRTGADGGVELTAFHRLTRTDRRALTEEAQRLASVLAGRDPVVYRRYGHWWDKGLPVAERMTVGP